MTTTVDGLVNGTQYLVRVRTLGTGGAGEWSQRLSTPEAAGTVNCTITGTAGDDVLRGTPGPDTICGLRGNDTLLGGGGDDNLIGGLGWDVVDYRHSAASVTVDLTTGSASGQGTDRISEVESVTGSRFSDTLTAGVDNSRLNGRGGSDLLTGGPGDDRVFGGAGADHLFPGPGDDHVDGGLGSDRVSFWKFSTCGPTGACGHVSVDLARGTATGEGSDRLTAVESVSGSPHADTIRGSDASNVLRGAGGDDTIVGLNGDDVLYGGRGSDALLGGVGIDNCHGGKQTDTATCERTVSVP